MASILVSVTDVKVIKVATSFLILETLGNYLNGGLFYYSSSK